MGSVSAAASGLGLSTETVDAAIRTTDAPPQVGADGVGGGGSTVGALKDALGVLSSSAIVAIVLGGLVLAARLKLVNLPPTAVVGQLPREFLLTVAVGQVLIPAMLFAGLYSFLRAVGIIRSTDFGATVVWLTCAWLGLMSLIVFVAARTHGGPGTLSATPGFWVVAAVLVTLALSGAGYVRHAWDNNLLRWRRGPEWLTLTVTYGFVAMVVAAGLAATQPLLEAKACTSTGFEERGSLVGQSNDRVYLGEPTRTRRRIASLPMSQVEELFIGPDAGRALCDPRGPAAAVVAGGRAKTSDSARGDARALLPQVIHATSSSAIVDLAVKLADATRTVGRATRTVADGADTADQATNELSLDAERIDEAGERAVVAAGELQNAADRLRGATSGPKPTLARVRALAKTAEQRAENAADGANTLAEDALTLVTDAAR
jgi:hypothetical protein